MALEARDDPVVAATGTLWGPEKSAGGGRRWLLPGGAAGLGVLRRRGSAMKDRHLRLLLAAHPGGTTQESDAMFGKREERRC